MMATFSTIIFYSLFSSFNLWADFDSVTIKNLSANYSNPTGEGKAEIFEVNFPLPPIHPYDVAINFYRKDRNIVLVYDGPELTWNNAPVGIQNIKTFTLKNLNLKTENNLFKAAVSNFSSFTTSGQQLFKNIEISCFETPSELSFVYKIIDSCTTQSTGKAAEISSKGKTLPPPFSNELRFKNSVFSVKNHFFKIDTTLLLGIDTNVKMDGMIWYRPVDMTIKIRLDNANTTLMSIKETLFKALDYLQIPDIKVERPYIYIKISELISDIFLQSRPFIINTKVLLN